MKYSLFVVLLFTSGLQAQVSGNFVRKNDTQFTINSKPYHYIGTNYWYGSLLALHKDENRGKERLKAELDFLQQAGVTNLRILAGAEGKGIINEVYRVAPPLQPEQGVFNEEVLYGLDYLLTEMGKRKMKAVIYLSNNWEWSGGFLQYLNWNGLIADSTLQRKPGWDELRDQVSGFYSCNPCKDAYASQVRYIISHTNKYTGLKYADEPTIMSWEIANEPRPMRPAAVNDYKRWIREVATLIKSADPNHLLTIGTEGYIGTEQSAALFEEVHTDKLIDYLTIHIWPKNWGWFSDTSVAKGLPVVIRKTTDYIQQHISIATKLQKPLVIEEFGLPRNNGSFSVSGSTQSRDKYYKAVFDIQQTNPVIAGVNFWAFGGTARPVPGQHFRKDGDDYMGDPPQEEQGLNTVFDSDSSTWHIIRHYTNQLKFR